MQWVTLQAYSSRVPDSIVTSGCYRFSVHVLPMSRFLPFPKNIEGDISTAASFQTEMMSLDYKVLLKMIIFDGQHLEDFIS